MRVSKFLCFVGVLGVTVSSSPTKWFGHQIFEGRSSENAVNSELEARANPQLRIMVAGASIASGYHSTDGNGFRLGLQEAVVAAGNDVQMLGTVRTGKMKDNAYEAKPGIRIDEVTARLDAALPKISPSPNIILVQVGANDLGQNFKVDKMAERMTTLIDHIYRHVPDANVIISTLLPSGKTESGVVTFNAQLPGVVEAQNKQGRHVFLADVHSGFSLADILPLPDGTHPTDAGYLKMAGVYAGVVLDVVKTRFAPPPPPVVSTSSSAPEVKPTPEPEPSTIGDNPNPTTTSPSPSPTSSSVSESSSESATKASSSTGAQRQVGSMSTSTVHSSKATSSSSATVTPIAASTSGPASTPSPSAPSKNGASSELGQPGSLITAIAMLACAIPFLTV
ncbi:hypothetical protein VTL71DRAFT_1636 [Oculimacula yallundae]|uniref:SGNH hydrolase-type esterase domain-containing protein n=1 Tax=Oculimacula yallundae TaxID=86028 RepID=A0ABR4CC29_9HELO